MAVKSTLPATHSPACLPSLVVHPHALVGDGRTVETAAFLPNETLGAYIERLGVKLPAGPVSVWHNGCRVPDALWRRLIPRNGDQVVIRQRVTGGGGSGSKVLRTIAMIAVVIISYFAPYLAPVAWGVGPGTIGGAALSAGILVGGSFLVNTLLPLPIATASNLGASSKYEDNPSYALSGGQNQARLWEPMMLLFGLNKVTPDYGANYFTQYVGNTQYLNQIFHFGLQQDSVELSNFCIGDTPVSNYQGIQLQLSDPVTGSLSMFPGNVDAIQGVTLQSGVINSRTTSVNTTHISVELAASLYYLNDAGGLDARSVRLRIQWRPTGTDTWTDIGLLQDAIYATHYWSLVETVTSDLGDSGEWTRQIQVRYGSTNYADHTPGEQVILVPATEGHGDNDYSTSAVIGTWVWAVHPFQLGQPWAGIAPDPLLGYSSSPGVELTGASQVPVRKTISWDVAAGQYDVQIWKETADIATSRESNACAVNQILCYQPDTADYTGQLRVALSIQATAQLNGAVDQFNAMAQVYCPVWNGSAWVWAASSNPAWSFLWYARGKFDAEGNRIYGAGLADSRIDIEGIKAWGAFCDAKKLGFNYVLTEAKSVHDVLTMIARCGRASYTWQTGKLGVIWDAADLPIVAMIGPYNIKAATFEVDYTNDQTADKVVLNFINPDRDWQVDSVHVDVPDVGQTNSTVTLDLDGCTNADQAGREANLIAADQAFHRRKVSWEMDIEGMVATRGDVVQMSHDLTVWSYAGRCLGLTGTTITLDKLVPAAATGWVTLRAPDNTMATVQVTAVVGDVDILTIASALPEGFALPGDAGYEDVVVMDWAWQFDPLATPGRRIKIIDVQPSGTDGVKFTGIDDTQDYYACETNLYAYTPPRDGALLSGTVLSLTATEQIVSVVSDQIRVTAAWLLSMDAPAFITMTVNGTVRLSQTVQNRSQDIVVSTGDTIVITVVPQRSRATAGAAKAITYNVLGLAEPLPAVTGLTTVFRDNLTVLTWSAVIDMRNPGYEVRLGSDWNNARTIAVTSALELLAVGNGQYWVAARYQLSNGMVVYGAPDDLVISGASLVRNVMVERDEALAWDGDLADGAYINAGALTLAPAGDVLALDDVLSVYPDILWVGGAVSSGIYTVAESQRVDIGYAAPVRVGFNITAHTFNLNSDILSVPDVLAMADVLGGSDLQHISLTPQVRTAQDDGVWGDWQNYIPGLINARHFDMRLLLATDDPTIVPVITQFEWVIDVPDLVQHAEAVSIPEDGVHMPYDQAFHVLPNVQITILEAQAGDQVVLTGSDEEGFTVQITNDGAGVARSINWLSQGY